MRKFSLLFVVLFALSAAHVSAQQRHWVHLTDDAGQGSDWRGRLVDAGADIAVHSRWLNAVSVSADIDVLERIAVLPFVRAIEPVRTWQRAERLPAPLASQPERSSPYGLDYGGALEQVELIRVPQVHELWIDGTGITVGMLDNGFRWRTHEAMSGINVRDEYDFIFDDTLTQNEDGKDSWSQDAHGTVTFSTIAGFKQGMLIGPAFNAEFYLAKTERNGSETQIEEDYWVAGIEWLAAQGATIVSASLGYSTWDDGTGYRYENGDFDGRTAVTTRAAVEAMRRGIVVVTAMGNEGSSRGSLIAPADADSIIAVGAVDFNGDVAGFSSRGPTNDLRIKPDICAPGVSVYCANKNADDTYERNNGTSMATPLAAGVAALVRSARPELTPVQVRDALRLTADNADAPDNASGWGVINAWDAILFHGMVISTNPKLFYGGGETIVMAWVASMSPVLESNVRLHWVHPTDGAQEAPMQLVSPLTVAADGSGLYSATIGGVPEGNEVRFHIAASDSRESRTSPYGAPTATHSFTAGESRTLGAEHLLPASLTLHQNYPNPYLPAENALTTIRFEVPMPGGQVRLDVFDALGRRVRTLVEGFRGVGSHSVDLTGTLPSGIYYYTLSSGDSQVMRRMLILR